MPRASAISSWGAAIAQTEANKGKESAALAGLRASAGADARAAGDADEAYDEAETARATGGLASGGRLETKQISNIVFACDAGMGSSAMGASVLRNKITKAGITDVTVTNKAIANLDGTEDLIITQAELTDRAKHVNPSAVHVSVDNFMNSPKYDEVAEMLSNKPVSS